MFNWKSCFFSSRAPSFSSTLLVSQRCEETLRRFGTNCLPHFYPPYSHETFLFLIKCVLKCNFTFLVAHWSLGDFRMLSDWFLQNKIQANQSLIMTLSSCSYRLNSCIITVLFSWLYGLYMYFVISQSYPQSIATLIYITFRQFIKALWHNLHKNTTSIL